MYTFDFKNLCWVTTGPESMKVTDTSVLEKLNKAKAFKVVGSVETQLTWPALEKSFKTGVVGKGKFALGKGDKIDLLQDEVDCAFTKKKPGRKPGLAKIKKLVKPVEAQTKIVAQRVVGNTVVSAKDTSGKMIDMVRPVMIAPQPKKIVVTRDKPVAFLKQQTKSGDIDLKTMCAKLGVRTDEGDQSEIVSDLMKKCREKLEEAEVGGDEENASHLQSFMRKINEMSANF